MAAPAARREARRSAAVAAKEVQTSTGSRGLSSGSHVDGGNGDMPPTHPSHLVEDRLRAATARVASGLSSLIVGGAGGESPPCARAGNNGSHHHTSVISGPEGHPRRECEPRSVAAAAQRKNGRHVRGGDRRALHGGQLHSDVWGSGSRCSPVPAEERPPLSGRQGEGGRLPILTAAKFWPYLSFPFHPVSTCKNKLDTMWMLRSLVITW